MQKEMPIVDQEECNASIYRRKEENKADYDYAKIKAEYETQLRRETREKQLLERKDVNFENSSMVNGNERSDVESVQVKLRQVLVLFRDFWYYIKIYFIRTE